MLTNASWLSGTRLAGDILHLLLFIVLSRYFGPEGVGQYAYGFAIAGLAFAGVNLGLEDYAIRECARLSLPARRTLIGRLLGIQMGSMVCIAAGLLGFLFVTQASTAKTAIVLLLSAHQFAFACSRLLFSPAFAEQQIVGRAIAELLCRAAIIFSTLALVLGLHVRLPVALIPFPVGGLVLLVIAVISARHHLETLSFCLRWDSATQLFWTVWPFAASVLLYYIYARASYILISFSLGDTATGLYAFGIKCLEVGVIPLRLLGLAAYPQLSRLFEHDPRRFLDTAERMFRATLVLGGLLAWALVFFVPIGIIPFLGARFAAAIPLVKALASLSLLLAVSNSLVRMLFAMHLQLTHIKIYCCSVVLQVLLTLALLPLLDILGAVVASMVALIVTNVLLFKVFHWEMTIAPLLQTLLSFSVILSLAAVSGVLAAWSTPHIWWPAIASLLTFCAIVLATGFVPLQSSTASQGSSVRVSLLSLLGK